MDAMRSDIFGQPRGHHGQRWMEECARSPSVRPLAVALARRGHRPPTVRQPPDAGSADRLVGARLPAALQPEPARSGRSSGARRRHRRRTARRSARWLLSDGRGGRLLPLRRRARDRWCPAVRPRPARGTATDRSGSHAGVSCRRRGVGLHRHEWQPVRCCRQHGLLAVRLPPPPADDVHHGHLGAHLPRQLAGSGGERSLGPGLEAVRLSRCPSSCSSS